MAIRGFAFADADSKLVINWLVGGRSSVYANEFVSDLADRLTDHVQVTSDGWEFTLSHGH